MNLFRNANFAVVFENTHDINMLKIKKKLKKNTCNDGKNKVKKKKKISADN